MISPEQTSRAFNPPPEATGDYTPNMFTQGELLGAMLDLMIKGATGGRHSLDDAMRDLSERFSIERGFIGADVEQAVARACSCKVGSFFDQYVRSAHPLDFDRWLAVVGLRTVVTWTPALKPDSTPAPDARLWMYEVAGEPAPALRILFPETLWGRAGLHTGDRLESWNGEAVSGWPQFREALGKLRIGDTVRVSVRRGSAPIEKTIIVTGYQRPIVRLEPRPDTTPAQRSLLAQWVAGR
jgi:predicted metalloprotease with PDZ domain